MTDTSLGLVRKVIARTKTAHLPWPRQFGRNEPLGKLLRLRMISHSILLLRLYLFSADFVDSHRERQRSKGASESLRIDSLSGPICQASVKEMTKAMSTSRRTPTRTKTRTRTKDVHKMVHHSRNAKTFRHVISVVNHLRGTRAIHQE